LESVTLDAQANTITYVGTNFYTTGHTISARYIQIEADSIEVVSETNIVATWNRGVPVSPLEGN
jgi:hypothetical protein